MSARLPTKPPPEIQRRCVVCRERDAAEAMLRVVRTPSGGVECGRTEGRGAYLHHGDCLIAALRRPQRILGALRLPPTQQHIVCLRDLLGGESEADPPA